MIRWRQKTAHFSLGMVCVLVGYVSISALVKGAPKDVTRASGSETARATIRVTIHYSSFELDRAPVDESVSAKLSAIAEPVYGNQLEEDARVHGSKYITGKQGGHAQSDSGHEHDDLYEVLDLHKALQVINPRSAALLAHYAHLQPFPLSNDQSKDYLNSEEYAFLLAISYMCEKCAFAIMFYEKFALGRSMSFEELKTFFDSPEFVASIDAAMSTDEYQNLQIEFRL